jgi:hypothetical protein
MRLLAWLTFAMCRTSIHCVESHRNFNYIGVRSFILSGAPSNRLSLFTFGAIPISARIALMSLNQTTHRRFVPYWEQVKEHWRDRGPGPLTTHRNRSGLRSCGVALQPLHRTKDLLEFDRMIWRFQQREGQQVLAVTRGGSRPSCAQRG